MADQTDHYSIDEARQYWGYLFQQDKGPTELLSRLLHGIANYIVRI